MAFSIYFLLLNCLILCDVVTAYVGFLAQFKTYNKKTIEMMRQFGAFDAENEPKLPFKKQDFDLQKHHMDHNKIVIITPKHVRKVLDEINKDIKNVRYNKVALQSARRMVCQRLFSNMYSFSFEPAAYSCHYLHGPGKDYSEEIADVLPLPVHASKEFSDLTRDDDEARKKPLRLFKLGYNDRENMVYLKDENIGTMSGHQLVRILKGLHNGYVGVLSENRLLDLSEEVEKRNVADSSEVTLVHISKDLQKAKIDELSERKLVQILKELKVLLRKYQIGKHTKARRSDLRLPYFLPKRVKYDNEELKTLRDYWFQGRNIFSKQQSYLS